MSVICFLLELGHSFLEPFLATYGFARFFLTKIPHDGELASPTRYLTAPLYEIVKNSKYLDVRPFQKKFRNFAPVSLPKVKKAAFNTELRKQGSHRTIRRGFKV